MRADLDLDRPSIGEGRGTGQTWTGRDDEAAFLRVADPAAERRDALLRVELARRAPLSLALDPDRRGIVERRLAGFGLALHALERRRRLGKRQRDVVAVLSPLVEVLDLVGADGGVARNVDAISPVRVSVTVISSGP